MYGHNIDLSCLFCQSSFKQQVVSVPISISIATLVIATIPLAAIIVAISIVSTIAAIASVTGITLIIAISTIASVSPIALVTIASLKTSSSTSAKTTTSTTPHVLCTSRGCSLLYFDLLSTNLVICLI